MILLHAARYKIACVFWAIALSSCWAAQLRAVVIAGPYPNVATTIAPADDPGWRNVGTGPYSNVYLGNGWVLEAYHCHVAAGSTDSATIDGTYYTGVSGSGIRLTDPFSQTPTDLYLFRINPNPVSGYPSLPSLAISSSNSSYTTTATSPGLGTVMTGIGNGYGRQTNSTSWNSAWVEGGTPATYFGYKLTASYGPKRWGQNELSGKDIYLSMGTFLTVPLGNVVALQMYFDKPGSVNSVGDTEFQLAGGDSGGGLFVKDSNNVWNLAGILEAAGGVSGQPGVAYQTVVYGDNTMNSDISYATDLSYYRNQIVAEVKVFQISTILNDPTAAIGPDWKSIQLVGNGGFGAATGAWSLPIDTNVFNFTVNSGANTVEILPGTGTATGIISGNGGLIKEGAGGTLILSAANTYHGPTTINAGVLQIAGGNDRLPAGTALTLANVGGAALDINNFAQTLGTLSGGGALGGDVMLGSGTLTVGDASSSIYSGAISGVNGNFIKTGSGTLTLNGANTYTGNTTVLDGGLNVGILNTPAATVSVLGAGSALTATSIVADTLSIGSGGEASAFIPALTLLSATVVPEPSTWMLLLLGAIGLGAVRWLRCEK